MPKFYYLIAVHNSEDHQLYYLQKDRTLSEFGSIFDAIKFDSFEDLIMYANHSSAKQFLECGFCIVHVFEGAIEKAKKDSDMLRKLHDPLYMLWGIKCSSLNVHVFKIVQIDQYIVNLLVKSSLSGTSNTSNTEQRWKPKQKKIVIIGHTK